MALAVGLAGLGAIGFTIAKGLDAGLEGLKLTLVAVSDVHHAKARLAQFSSVPHLVSLSELAEADIVIEALPALLFDRVAGPAIEAGKLFIPCSVRALLKHWMLVERAREIGAESSSPPARLVGLTPCAPWPVRISVPPFSKAENLPSPLREMGTLPPKGSI